MASTRTLRLAALVGLAAPVVLLAVLFFGGATVGNCHRPIGGSPGSLCPVEIVVGPPIRTEAGLAFSAAALALSWLVATCIVLAHVVRYDQARLLRSGATIVLMGAAASGIGFLRGLALTERLRYAADDAFAWGLAGLLITSVLFVAWAGLRSDGPPTPRSTGRP